MKRFWKRAAALMISGMLLLSTACTGTDGSSSSQTEGQTAAMGRYVEEEYGSIPDGTETIAGLKSFSDGSMEMLVSKTENMVRGPWYLYRSEDGGESWQQKDLPWLSQLDQATVMAMDWTPDGGIAVAYSIYTDELVAAMDEAVRNQDFETALALQPETNYTWFSGDGSSREMPLDIPLSSDGQPATPRDIAVTEGGDIIFNDYLTLYQMDSQTGKVKNTYQPTVQPKAFLTMGDQLAMVEENRIHFFDLNTGERLETVEIPSGDGSGILAADEQALYYCDSTGIYRLVNGGGVLELVVDGSLTSLNMPSINCFALIPQEGENFLGFFSGDGYSTLRYRYDETIPTVPSTQLRVYSLEDNDTIRETMALFQRRHPDVQVSFEVGLPEDGSITTSDALRGLSTQLLAGQGPDILVLDGMPVDSYIEKQVLLELSDGLSQQISSGELLENIVAGSREADGSLYAIPARFQVPLALADSQTAEKLTNLEALAEYQAQEIRSLPQMADFQGNPMEPHPNALIRTFYPVCAPYWFGQDGSVNLEQISLFLESLKKITDATGRTDWGEYTSMWGAGDYDLSFAAVYWNFGYIPMAYGISNTFDDIAPCEEAISQKGDGKLFLLPGQGEPVFIPSTLLGVSAGSAHQELALEFVQLALSDQVQSHNFGGGYAVNAAAFQQSAQNPYPPTDDGMTYGAVAADGSYQYFQVIWPDEDYMEQVKEMIRGVDTASRVDLTARQIVLDESWEYFRGNRTLEDTVTAIGEKLRLYLTE
ncbi:ABC transporter substrate-binding protein [Angelakisella massiliensis]|uniref:ABC transporter substrate-binding protein n=1 Tax=Angelakisella massiliensis TaxID=1871018 RepID=UPI0008F87E50|nr:ABC transporter substrate-binding protein [Angelakisella massiliensis]